MERLAIVNVSPTQIKPRKNNSRTHSPTQVRQIAKSISEFGWVNPIIVDDGNTIIAGEGRYRAALQLGLSEIPVIQLSHMTEAQIRAYVIADNRLAELAGWDRKLLGLELQYLSELEIDLDITVTGFELPAIDVLITEANGGANNNQDPADEVPELQKGDAVTRLGDIWLIGRHKLICGDSTERSTYEALLGSDKAQMVFSDPPYNVPIEGHVSGLGKVKHGDFAMGVGELSSAEFAQFLASAFRHLAAFSEDGSIHFQCIDWRHLGEMLAAGMEAYTELKNICVWAKTNAGMGSLYRSQHEFVYVFKSGSAAHINNIELGRHGRYRSNLWTYAGVNSFGSERASLELHPTVKPVALVCDAIRDCSHRKGLVLDPFLGSGTTLVAAEKTARVGYGIELDPHYCDVSIRRLKAVCGLEARLEATGETFDETAAKRRRDNEEAA